MNKIANFIICATFFLCGFDGFALAQFKSGLPSSEARNAIQALQGMDVVRSERSSPNKSSKALIVDPHTLPQSERKKFTAVADGKASVPFVYPNTMILQLKPDINPAELQKLLTDRDLKVIRTFPNIGTIQVEADLSKFFVSEITDNNSNDTILRGVTQAIREYNSDPRIQSAAPDLLLRDQSVTNLYSPQNIVVSGSTLATEITDWGIADIEANQVWTQAGAQDGAVIGVMDAGFNRHEDLVFLGIPKDTPVNDHGNHVAGIACGQHGNAKGIKGVIPNCFVRPRAGKFFFDSTEGGEVLDFVVRFSQILGTLNDFVSSQDDVHVFNLSLGYNWIPNFNINPDDPGSAPWRAIVASQGTIMVSILELADKNNKVIYSAAGNDSSGLASPINSKFSSPFNWAAITARQGNITRNGIVVEAHDQNGKRASFSNTGGNISCPGVDIFSTVAYDALGELSTAAYGKMSGTSMASPYCAGGHTLFSLVRPSYSGIEISNCFEQSQKISDSGAPMLKLRDALQRCPAK